MAPRLSGQTSIFGVVSFVFKSLLGIGPLHDRSHGTKSHMLVSMFRSGTSKTKAGPGGLVRVALFCKSHCATCSPACVIL